MLKYAQHVPCKSCGKPTNDQATKECSTCWQLRNVLLAETKRAGKILQEIEYQQGHEIARTLVISTSHVPKHVADALEANSRERYVDCGKIPPMWAREYGWLIHVYDDPEDDKGVIPEIQAICAFARAINCQWVMLDADGQQIVGLKTWEW